MWLKSFTVQSFFTCVCWTENMGSAFTRTRRRSRGRRRRCPRRPSQRTASRSWGRPWEHQLIRYSIIDQHSLHVLFFLLSWTIFPFWVEYGVILYIIVNLYSLSCYSIFVFDKKKHIKFKCVHKLCIIKL